MLKKTKQTACVRMQLDVIVDRAKASEMLVTLSKGAHIVGISKVYPSEVPSFVLTPDIAVAAIDAGIGIDVEEDTDD